ncbi:hypothetical protein [Salipiger abyssi]|uniref:Uncharacterized protein n=1 Tax=Salipiger abyssi TaxID=1250539 RepID=A0A1P8UXX2_9RHOB|nr:hypothetical protein [Salipiger abyssi]APZ54244.1 hypothetical protein Ga0080574_TMP3910 [Salipiger abyssi]
MKTLTILQAAALAVLAVFGAYAAHGQPPSCDASNTEISTPCDL